MGWKAGTVVMQAQPYAHVIMQKFKQDRCNFCLRSCDSLKKCVVCKKVWYCGPSCQKKDWKVHKLECPVMSRVPDSPTDSMRLLLRLVIRHLLGSSSVRQEKEESPCIRSFDDLMSHTDDISIGGQRSSLYEVAQDFLHAYTHGLMSLPVSSVLRDIFGKMVINTFTIVDESLQDVAVGIYNSPSILDHRCNNNAVATFNGRGLTVRAVTDIEGNDLSHVHLCYIDPLATTAERQAQLRHQYYFFCSCVRCTSDDVERQMCSLEGGTRADLFKVKSCLEKVESMLKSEESPQSLLSTCQQCLSNVSLPASNVHLVRLRSKAYDAAIEAQEWDTASRLGLQNITPYSSLQPAHNPSVGYMHANLGKLLLYLGQLSEAETYLVQGFKTLLMSLGDIKSGSCWISVRGRSGADDVIMMGLFMLMFYI